MPSAVWDGRNKRWEERVGGNKEPSCKGVALLRESC
jgi:hypothetical protein